MVEVLIIRDNALMQESSLFNYGICTKLRSVVMPAKKL